MAKQKLIEFNDELNLISQLKNNDLMYELYIEFQFQSQVGRITFKPTKIENKYIAYNVEFLDVESLNLKIENIDNLSYDLRMMLLYNVRAYDFLFNYVRNYNTTNEVLNNMVKMLLSDDSQIQLTDEVKFKFKDFNCILNKKYKRLYVRFAKSHNSVLYDFQKCDFQNLEINLGFMYFTKIDKNVPNKVLKILFENDSKYKVNFMNLKY